MTETLKLPELNRLESKCSINPDCGNNEGGGCAEYSLCFLDHAMPLTSEIVRHYTVMNSNEKRYTKD